MKFFTSCQTPRPVRLSPETRLWAWESLHGKYGDEAMTAMSVSLDGIAGFDDMTQLEKYDAAIAEIARLAPVRVLDREPISGSATLGAAVGHDVPATRGGEIVFPSVSHLTLNYKKTLDIGINGYEAEIDARMRDDALQDKQRAFLKSLKNTIASLRVWHKRYLDATEITRPEIHKNLLRVPFEPARNFTEAVQALWFEFAFARLCGNWPGIGRIDWLLGDYLKADLKSGALTIPQAREILAGFFIKGCEWIRSNPDWATGDAQHYQNLVLAGIDENGREITNEVTYLALDIVEELAISDFPISVRVNARTGDRLLRKIARVMRHGGGIIAIYNEDIILRALELDGYQSSEIWQFANDGCWEVQLPGRTNFGYFPFDALQIFDRALGLDSDGDVNEFGSVEEIYQAFLAGLRAQINEIFESQVENAYRKRGEWWEATREALPSSVISLFEDGCIEHAASYYDFGTEYTIRAPHIGGAPDVANSLYAIDELVFKRKLTTLPELISLLRNNWEGLEELRLYARNKLTYYGNDDDAPDAYMTRLINDFANIVLSHPKAGSGCPVHFAPGVSTFGRQIDWMPMRRAVAFGYRKGEILSGNDSPTPGTDASGATAIIKSYCKADLARQTTGAALDIRIFPETLNGEDGIRSLKALIRGFVELGGFFMQIDTVDAKTLIAARENPEEYKTLSVRVSGWNARFVTLCEKWQDMIIERTAQGI